MLVFKDSLKELETLADFSALKELETLADFTVLKDALVEAD